jgi:hypothetical protein
MRLKNKIFRHIYIVDNMANWQSLKIEEFSSTTDLVLTFDLELYKHIESIGGSVKYFDHLVDTSTMEKNNYLIYEYFARWNLDKNCNDLLCYKGVDFGFSFRCNFWNDYVTYIRLFLSALVVKDLDFRNLFLCSNDQIENIFEMIGSDFNVIKPKVQKSKGFYFQIDQWMDEKIRPRGVRKFFYKTREIAASFFGNAKSFQDKLLPDSKKVIFFQSYHPTYPLINFEILRGKYRVLLDNFSKNGPFINKFKQRIVPISANTDGLNVSADEIMFKLKKGACNKLKIVLNNNEFDITKSINEIIFRRVDEVLINKLRLIEGSISYLNSNRLNLLVLIANIGEFTTIFDLVCKNKNIPSFMIINGLMAHNYMDEAKYATYINSYSESIKENYFKGMKNIVAIGDPRMDNYSTPKIKKINREFPTIVIGASGFNVSNLNSYTAVEFDFIYDILQAIQTFQKEVKIIIKVRPNGYKRQYLDFVSKYFNKLDVDVVFSTQVRRVLEKSDLYISIYSQTLFEASCLGIPVIYYKKDTEVINPPFDGNSELVTIKNVQELIQALIDFQKKHVKFNAFLKRSIMEKYIGPLDGKNIERNINFIEKILTLGKGHTKVKKPYS